MKLLAFGGTFDPVHNGHVAMWDAAIQALQPDIALVIPVGNPWQKGRAPIASAEARMAMLRLALPNARIDDRELVRSGPTYTIDTLIELAAKYAQHELLWLLGSDSADRLHTWHRATELAALATFISMRRADAPQPDSREASSAPFRIQPIDYTPPAVSSTAIRAALAAGAPIRGMVPESVCDYIQQHNLYQ